MEPLSSMSRTPSKRISPRIGGNRTPARKREVNPRKNILWDSWAGGEHPSRIDSGATAVDDRVVVLGLLLGCLTNLACLYSYL